MLGEGQIFFDVGGGGIGNVGAEPLPDTGALLALQPLLIPDAQAGQQVYVPQNADTFGAVTIPTQAPAPGDPVGDPCLRVILDFLQAFLVTDANATAAWNAAIGNNPSSPWWNKPVLKTMAEDPRDLREGTFSTSWLPCLFLWREAAPKEERIAEDWLHEATQVKGLWVFPLALPDVQRQRSTFANALMKALHTGVERGRTPSYVVPGDPDPLAPTQGSLFWKFAGFESFALESWRKIPGGVQIEVADKGIAGRYPGIEMTFLMQENLVYGLDQPPFYPNRVPDGVDLTIVGPDGRPVVRGLI